LKRAITLTQENDYLITRHISKHDVQYFVAVNIGHCDPIWGLSACVEHWETEPAVFLAQQNIHAPRVIEYGQILDTISIKIGDGHPVWKSANGMKSGIGKQVLALCLYTGGAD
jgi:hypothetical protein